MKTILEIQKLDRQIVALNREVDRCPASINYNKYVQMMQEGKVRYTQVENQAKEIIKNYEKSANVFSKSKGESEILRKRNVENMDLENASDLISDVNSLVGSLSEEHRKAEELVRKAEELVRKSIDLNSKLVETKKRRDFYKEKIKEKKLEVEPKIAEIEQKIKALEPNVEDKDKYAKYLEMKEKGIFPVFVNLEDVFCGGCKVELSLNFIEKLKTKKMLTCEHCGRIIMFK